MEEYLNAEGVIKLSQKLLDALAGLGNTPTGKQYWFNWFPEAEEDEYNPDTVRIYLRPYMGTIDSPNEAPTQGQYELARLVCNEADMVQGLGLLSLLNFESPYNYYVRVNLPVIVLALDEPPFTYDPIHGRFYLLSLYNVSEMDILEMALMIMFLLPKIIVTIFKKEIFGEAVPLYPVELPEWLAGGEEEEEEEEE